MKDGLVSELRWLSETLHEASGLKTLYAASKVIHEDHTGQQHLVLFENPHFGRVLVLDGAVQLTTSDEFIYHEMMSHVPLFAHGAARNVLIIGGGDGGVAREVLRHKNVENVTQVEIDAGVVEFSKKFLPQVSDGAFENPRLNLLIDDGAAFVNVSGPEFDVILVDSTDPVGPGAVLFTKEFYRNCASALRPGGVLVTQNGVPFMQASELRSTMTAFQQIFADHTAYCATIPTYVGGPMAFGWGCKNEGLRNHDLATIASRFAAAGMTTRYYTPQVHLGAFALPAYIDAMVSSA